MFRKLAAECFGTFWLVFGGCGSAVLAAAFPELGIGFVGVALAFGSDHVDLDAAAKAGITVAEITGSNSISVAEHVVMMVLSLITAHLKDLPDDGRNEDVFKMLRSSAAILHGINNLRNNYSMAHPTETLLNEADARFAINLVRSIMTYVDELL